MAAPGSIAITFQDVTKTFPRPDGSGQFTAVDRISFEVARGEIVAVLGKTGCGKSTIFNLIAGLSEPTRAASRSRASIRSAISRRCAARSASCSRATG